MDPFQLPVEVHNSADDPDKTYPKLHWNLTRSPKWYFSLVDKRSPFSGALKLGHITGTHDLFT